MGANFVLSNLDVSANTELGWLHVHNNSLKSIDISKCTKLYEFRCQFNPGEENEFRIKTWFNSAEIPDRFEKEPWNYKGSTVTPVYYK